MTKHVGTCTAKTLAVYGSWLHRLLIEVSEVTPLSVRQFFAGLAHRSTSTQHQAYRTRKTFFRW